ncbi:MAG TPA: UrcA family protein [Sphingomicrobium sp.]|nr:UrcA family protein [Sphingomicrobium sp.]
MMTGAASVALTGLAGETPAFGKDVPVVVYAPSDVVTRSVSYADLDLAFPPGERTLNRRVSGALSSYCSEMTGGYDGLWSTDINAMRRCLDSAWNQARPQVKRAVDQSRGLALIGSSPVAAAAIVIAVPK